MSKNLRNDPKNEKDPRKLRVLLVPLDWGLGHATRCIPVVYELINQNVEVWLAGEGAQTELLAAEFPQLPILPLKGYRVKYARSAAGLFKSMLFQAPRILAAIREEHAWLKKMVDKYDFDAVISDNRYGLYHSRIPSVFITHQLLIKNPLGKWMERILQKRNYRFINRFTECWVPDEQGIPNFAGALSHPSLMPAIPVYYTGILSRLSSKGVPEKKHHLFISLSGPEPQRSLLEDIVVEEISHYNSTATIVRGLPGHVSHIPSTKDIQFHNHLSSDEYNREMEKAEWVISRSGYSTIMDILMLGKKSVLIPTPGQSEQEYLASHLQQMQIASSLPQEKLNLQKILDRAKDFNYQIPLQRAGASLEKNITRFLSSVSPRS